MADHDLTVGAAGFGIRLYFCHSFHPAGDHLLIYIRLLVKTTIHGRYFLASVRRAYTRSLSEFRIRGLSSNIPLNSKRAAAIRIFLAGNATPASSKRNLRSSSHGRSTARRANTFLNFPRPRRDHSQRNPIVGGRPESCPRRPQVSKARMKSVLSP